MDAGKLVRPRAPSTGERDVTDRTAELPRLQDIGVLVLLLLLCLAAGGLGAMATEPNIATWYAGLNKPPFNPPNAVFPVAWTILYLLMAVAAWLAWRAPAPDAGSRWRRLVPFFVQLVLNAMWSFAFFGAHNPLLGIIVIGVLLLAILWTIARFWQASAGAAALLLPYLLWVCFAAVLNVSIWLLN